MAKTNSAHLQSALDQLEKDRRTLKRRRSQIVDGALNGHSKDARKVLDRFIQNGGKIDEFADVADAAGWSMQNPQARNPREDTDSPTAVQSAAKAIGKPITLRSDLKNLDHPTVRFLAIRETVIADGSTFVICGDRPALLGFGDDGELQLVPLKATDKDGKEASWLKSGESMQRSFSSNLYGPNPNDGCREGNAQCLEWIKTNSGNAKARTKGGFYLTSQTDFDRDTALTTMGKRTALGLPELYLEWDDISEEEQLKRVNWLKGLGFSLTVVSSGGKSVHGHIHLDSVASFADAFPVLKLLTALAGSDPAVVSKARRMRLPGALRPNSKRLRGGAATTEQRLIEAADHSYDLAEVRRVLEAEAKQRGWKVDHIETRWSEYREALSALPANWASPEFAWQMDEAMAIAWSQARRNGGTDGDFDPPVEWRRDETELGWKIRHAEEKLFEQQGLAGAFEFVATQGTLIQKQQKRGWPGFEFAFVETAEGADGQSPFSNVRESGVYSGNSLRLFTESKHFYCWASQRKGGLGEWAAHWCPYGVSRPGSPTPEEQSMLGLWLWELAGLDRDEFDSNLSEKENLDKELRDDSLKRYENARKRKLELSEVLSADLAELLGTRAKAFPVAPLAMLPPFLTCAGAMLGTRYKVAIKKNWREPMVFWIGSVGSSSQMKSPVAREMLSPLLKLDSQLQTQYKEALRLYKALPLGERGNPPPPPPKIVAGDATLEGLCAALENPNCHGMVSHHDELVAFFASMDAYRGRGGPSKDRAHWLSLWDGGEINILRKGHDPIFIPETAVNLFGCVQQDKLAELLQGDDAGSKSGDGFWARFLWCVPSNPFPEVNWDESSIRSELGALYKALNSFNGRIEVALGGEAREVFKKRCDDWAREAMESDAPRAAFLLKMKSYLARLAGLLHALDYAERIKEPHGGTLKNIDREIPGEVMERAVKLAEFFVDQYDVLSPQVGTSTIPPVVAKVIELGDRQEKVTARDVLRRKWAADADAAKKLLLSLPNQYGRGRIIPAPRADQTWWSPQA